MQKIKKSGILLPQYSLELYQFSIDLRCAIIGYKKTR